MRRSFSVIGPFLILAYGLVRNALIAKVLLAALIAFVFLFLLTAAASWVWEGYGPAARARRRGRERIVGPEGLTRLPYATSPGRRGSLGPAFNLGRPRVRRPHRNGRRPRVR